MRAFLIGVAAMIVIAVIAAFVLDSIAESTMEMRQSESGSVRL